MGGIEGPYRAPRIKVSVERGILRILVTFIPP